MFSSEFCEISSKRLFHRTPLGDKRTENISWDLQSIKVGPKILTQEKKYSTHEKIDQ